MSKEHDDLFNKWVWHKVLKQPVLVFSADDDLIYSMTVRYGELFFHKDIDPENFVPLQVEELQY